MVVILNVLVVILGSHLYAKVAVFSKVPLPNYRFDLDDRRPQREVLYFMFQFTARFCVTYLKSHLHMLIVIVFFTWKPYFSLHHCQLIVNLSFNASIPQK